ncbi:MAG: TraB/GumN family protein [Calditrichota bacterium]
MKSAKVVIQLVVLTLFFSGCTSTNALLWEVNHETLQKPSYLFGTIHLIPESRFELTGVAENALRSCDRLLLEVNSTDPNVKREQIAAMVMLDGTTLKELLGELYDNIAEAYKDSFDIDLAQFNRINPYFISMMVSEKMLKEPSTSYEAMLLKKAFEHRMGVEGLETVADHVDLLSEYSMEDMIEELLTAPVNLNEQRLIMHEIIDLYLKEELQELYNRMKEEEDESDKYYSLIVEGRNMKWIPKIIRHMNTESTFIAVGAAHLPGELGLIQLLRKSGYSVTPLPSSK